MKDEELPECVTHHICDCLKTRMEQLREKNRQLTDVAKRAAALKSEAFIQHHYVVVDYSAWQSLVSLLKEIGPII